MASENDCQRHIAHTFSTLFFRMIERIQPGSTYTIKPVFQIAVFAAQFFRAFKIVVENGVWKLAPVTYHTNFDTFLEDELCSCKGPCLLLMRRLT